MKKTLSFFVMGLAALFLCPNAEANAGKIVVDTYLPLPAVVVYSSTWSIRTEGMNRLSAQVVVSSIVQTSPTFNDGRASTMTMTVASYLALSTTTASGTITVSTNSAVSGACVSGGGPAGTGNFNTCEGTDWTKGASAAQTACSLAAAIQSYSVILASCNVQTPGVIYTTSTLAGNIWNSFKVYSSTQAIQIVQMTGGQDNAVLTVNGKTFTANVDYYPKTSTTVTATALATAMAAASGTSGVTAAAVGAVVYATTTAVGTNTNYTVTTSTQSALTLAPYTSSSTVLGTATGSMIAGANAAYTLGTSSILIAGNNLGLAQGVWFSQTTGSGGLAPLVVGTTYYAIPGAGSTIQLALTSTGAIAGLPIVLTSSAANTTANVFKLNLGQPTLPGPSGLSWAVSNDNSHWVWYQSTPYNLQIPSVTYTTGGYTIPTGIVTNFDFGPMDYSYLGLSVSASTSAPTNVTAHIIGKE